MAENKDGQEKTEQATAKRLNEARMRGQVSKSQEITTAAVLLFGGTMIFLLGAPMIAEFRLFMIQTLQNLGTVDFTQQEVISSYYGLMTFLAKIMMPMLLVMFLIVLGAEISQVGFKIASKKFTEGLNFKQIFNPFKGLKKIFFSSRSVFELAKSILKLLILGVFIYQILNDRADETVGLIERPFTDIAAFLVSLSFELVIKVGAVFIIIAVADLFYQKYKFRDDMKMTKQEVKDENKQTEGDPKIKARLRSIMRQKLRNIMMKNVEQADVVITNPTHFAVAVSYKPGQMNAPVVVAKGADFLALQIRERAQEFNIPVVEQPPLARALYFTVDVEQEIPEELFKAVAQILAYVYSLSRKTV